MATPNRSLIYQPNAKRFLATTSSDAAQGRPNFTASEAREIGGVLGASFVGAAQIVNQNQGKTKGRNSRYTFTTEFLQAGQDTINLFQSTYADKEVHVAIEGSDGNYYSTSGSGFLFRSELEIDLSSEGHSTYRVIGETVSPTLPDVFKTPEASNIGQTNPTQLIQNSEKLYGPVCQVSWSQESGSNYTGSGEMTPEDFMISWVANTVPTSKGQMLERNGRLRIQFRVLQTDTGSFNDLKTFEDNDAYFRIVTKDATNNDIVISTAASGGMNLVVEPTFNFNQETPEAFYFLVHGEVVTSTILDGLNLPT